MTASSIVHGGCQRSCYGLEVLHAYLGLTSVIPNGTLDRRWPAFNHARAGHSRDSLEWSIAMYVEVCLMRDIQGKPMQTLRALTCLAAILNAATGEARSFTERGRHLMQMAGERMQVAALKRACSPRQDRAHA